MLIIAMMVIVGLSRRGLTPTSAAADEIAADGAGSAPPEPERFKAPVCPVV
jgi:hypothetical protein